ncbi:MAG: PQQ-like beta-propeller repeat protein [Pirellulales bacterium]|nr:PQQ-like beta-propeller repeat protein [Pirellulales bacterium]
MSLARWISLACLVFSVASVARGENWPQFRGPAGTGIPSESRLPTTWAPDKNIAWQVEIPGQAWSQPVVWGDRIFITTAIPEEEKADLTGGPTVEDKQEDEYKTKAPESSSETAKPDEAKPDESNPAEGEDERPRRRRGGGGFGGALPDRSYRWKVICLDANSGEVQWEQLAHEGKPTIPIHRTNTYASETPVTDGERVYAYFGSEGLYCYDLAGNLLWSKNLGSYPMMLGWGTGSSPALDEGRLFVQCDNEKESFLAAFDAKTGAELWRVPREEKSTWATPFVWHNKVRTELVAAGSKKMRAYDPATGKLLWETTNARGRCSATPVATDELLYVGVGGGPGGLGPLLAIRAGAKGDLTLEKDQTSGEFVAWMAQRSGPPMASPLVYQDCLYILDQGGGIIACYDAQTGQQHYRKRIDGAKGFTSSPWGYDGKIYCLDEEGTTFVIPVGPEFEVVATNKLDDRFWSSMAVSGNHLLLRGVNRLYCIAPE